MNDVDIGLFVVRVVIGLTFAAHGAQKAFGWWAGPGPQRWRGAMERMSMRPAGFWAAVSTTAELVGGPLFAVGLLTPIAVAALIAQLIAIIELVHRRRGFWNTGQGYEYPTSLMAVVVAVGVAGPGAISIDAAFGLAWPDSVRSALIVVGIVCGLVAIAMPVATRTEHPSSAHGR